MGLGWGERGGNGAPKWVWDGGGERGFGVCGVGFGVWELGLGLRNRNWGLGTKIGVCELRLGLRS